jgi:hypothetical protein
MPQFRKYKTPMPLRPTPTSTSLSLLRLAVAAFLLCGPGGSVGGVGRPALAAAPSSIAPEFPPSPGRLQQGRGDLEPGEAKHRVAEGKPKRGTGKSSGRANAELHLPWYAMAYIRSGAVDAGGGVPTRTAADLGSLYNAATRGYGVYTYVLLGRHFPNLAEGDVLRYRELLRLIQAYVLNVDGSTRGSAAESHAFLLAVYPWRSGQPLIEQTGPQLSDQMRGDMAKYVAGLGEDGLAERLYSGAGPFLVSSPEPRLVPSDRASPRLIADLSALPPEDLYPLVDAYDQSVVADGLDPIRVRLSRLRQAAPGRAGSDGVPGQWVYLLGGTPQPIAGPDGAAGRAPPPSPAAPSPFGGRVPTGKADPVPPGGA